AEVRRLLGTEVPIEECARILGALEYGIEVHGDAIRATVPASRLDVQEGPADLIEDIVRVYGYEKLPAALLREELPEQKGNAEVELEERLRDRLVTLGLQEVICYALTTPEKEAPLGHGVKEEDYVKLLNPISSE